MRTRTTSTSAPEQIAEVVGRVSLQLLTGAFNLVAGTQTTPTARSAK